MATRREERARGYRRPFERAGYDTEYAYRKARGASLGHRSFSDLRQRLDAARPQDSIISAVTDRDAKGRVRTVVVSVRDASTGRTTEYRLTRRGDTRRGNAAFDRKMRTIARHIAASDAPYLPGYPERPASEQGSFVSDLVAEERQEE